MTKKAALRFAGFGDEWNEVKLGEVTDIKTGGRDVQDSVEDGLYPFYIRSEEVKRINSYSFDGEAILIPGEGRLGEIFHYANGKFDVHQRVYKISNFTDVNAKFVLQQMKKDFKQHAMRNTVKATVDSLRLPTIQSFTVFVSSLPEQTAIGSFFQDIDQLIGLQQRKLEVLKEQKKTYLKLLFPAKGQTKPALRFAGFEDDWKEVKLGEIADYKNGKGYEDRQSDSGSYELINLNSISIDGGLKRSGKFIDKADETLEKGDLVMVLSDVAHGNLLGRVAIIPESNKFVLNQRVALLRPRLNSNSEFLYSYINSNQYYFKAQGAGMSQLNISRSSVENFSVYFPSLPEQEVIGSFFQDLDKAIAKQEEKVNQFKESKQTLLRKMFI